MVVQQLQHDRFLLNSGSVLYSTLFAWSKGDSRRIGWYPLRIYSSSN